VLVTHIDDEIDADGLGWAAVAGVGPTPFSAT
jgi:hypothetical protein